MASVEACCVIGSGERREARLGYGEPDPVNGIQAAGRRSSAAVRQRVLQCAPQRVKLRDVFTDTSGGERWPRRARGESERRCLHDSGRVVGKQQPAAFTLIEPDG